MGFIGIIFLLVLLLAIVHDVTSRSEKKMKLQKEQNDILKEQNVATTCVNVADELEKIFALKEKGAISNTEYEQMKRKIMGN